ncbi:hypothetical protein FQA39_LY12843 [Lamprigera yunnana]|nr:hypothetical protein FQA39_LY12843 [Lamprigera yunnana]
MQIYMLTARSIQLRQAYDLKNIIFDRTILEDPIFMKVNYDLGNLNEVDYTTYKNFYEHVVLENLKIPDERVKFDVVIYLKVSTDKAIERIKQRGRVEEAEIMGRAHEVRAASMAKTAAKKSAANGRASKEIYMAAKTGGPDPLSNLTLRTLIEKAKTNQIPKDVIDRAIKRAQGGDAETYTANRYEDGKVAFLFKEIAYFAFTSKTVEEVLEHLMLEEVEIDDVDQDEDIIEVFAPFKQYAAVKAALDKMGIDNYLVAETRLVPVDEYVDVTNEELKSQLQVLLDKLEELEDVQNVYTNLN